MNGGNDATAMFRDHVVLVTGAASGIGLSTARLFLEAQASVVGADVDEAALDRVHAGLGDRFVPAVCNIASEPAVATTAELVEKRFGRLDVLVNNAGRGTLVPLEAMQETDFYSHYDVLVKGPMLMVKHRRTSASPPTMPRVLGSMAS